MYSQSPQEVSASRAEAAFHPRSAPFVFACLITLAVGVALWGAAAHYPAFQDALHEDGPVEKVSAVLWGLCAVMVLYFVGGTALRTQWQLSALFFLLCGRELDFDKRFLSEGILQLRLYSGGAPLWEKVIGIAIIALVLLVVWRLLRVNLPVLLKGLRQLSLWAWGGAFAVSAIVVAKGVDGIGRKFADFGVILDPTLIARALVYEELLELFAAAIVAWSICHFEGQRRRARGGRSMACCS